VAVPDNFPVSGPTPAKPSGDHIPPGGFVPLYGNRTIPSHGNGAAVSSRLTSGGGTSGTAATFDQARRVGIAKDKWRYDTVMAVRAVIAVSIGRALI
jgi:hypothetical protein